MVNNMLQLRDHYGGLVAREVDIKLMGMVDEDKNVPASKTRRNI